jgi:hypothetical protein
MKLLNKKDARLSMENQKEIYAFLSKTIYNELIEYGIDEEYTFPFSLYLHWAVVRRYAKASKNANIYNTEKILKNLQATLEVGNEAYNQKLTNFIDAFFTDNSETLFSIYEDVNQADAPLVWLQEWHRLCKFCYTTNKSKKLTCLTLLRIVNECLNMPHHKTEISLNILLRIEKKQEGYG